MTWERFGYICRKVSAGIGENESISSCISRLDESESCALYGKPLSKLLLPKRILDKIGSFKNKDTALSALNIYKELNLSEKFEEPMRFKRVVAYLSYVTFVFYIVVAIYQLKVAPTFLNAFADLELSIPRHLGWYQDYWLLFVLIVSILLASSLIVGHHMRKIFKFVLGIENSFVFEYMIFGSIRKSYLKVIDILQFPITRTDEQYRSHKSELFKHLREVELSNMSVAVEMQELLRTEMRFLLEKCEQQMKYISILIALVVVAAVFFFLVSAYSPIFVLGETI